MQPLIDKTYFWGELKIDTGLHRPSGTLLGEAAANAESEIDKYIIKHQKEFLRQMFSERYMESVNWELPSELVAMIRDEDSIAPTSPLANYVYFFYSRANQTMSTPAGEKTSVIQNTAFTSQVPKMVNAWNEMVKKVRNIHEKLYNAKTIKIKDVDFDYIENIYNNVDFCSDIYETINVFGI